jgi:hypothetical protein
MSSTPRANALAQETSPYLLQHARNPVEWLPWGPEALDRARREDRPVLLSIGYSACHWCHVMAHESFEDEGTARLMNELYVNVKVDREERPDLDRVYQGGHQLIARRPGGWPLTVFLDPRTGAPFFAGTYFPREARHGLPAFREVLAQVAEWYRSHRDELPSHVQAMREALASLSGETGGDGVVLTAEPLHGARRQLLQSLDRRHGGFGGAPKFPHTPSLERLLRHHAAQRDDGAGDPYVLEAVTLTLERMALGGVYDQLGGGFCRYSVDDQWMIPHFEKMLYDNGPLLALCSEAWQVTATPLFRRVAAEVAEWVTREMQSPDGGYYSTLDADSEGEEGRYYVWAPEQVRALLDEDDYRVFARRFGLDRPPNFEGRWHLHTFVGLPELAAAEGLPEDAISARIDQARARLLSARAQRVPPGRDEKILTGWNGLMIRGMATAARVFGEPAWTASAERALDFIRASLWTDGRLLATFKDGRARLGAYLDDHAFLLEGVLALLQARWRAEDLAFAIELAEALIGRFEDREQGGFFFTAHDHESLIHRPKPLADESLPAGNGVAARALGALGHLLGEPRYLQAAERTLKAAWPAIQGLPYAHCSLLHALEEHLVPAQTVVLRGRGETLAHWARRCHRDFAPRRLTLAIPDDAVGLPGLLADRVPRGEAVAYVCEGFVCRQPATTFQELEELLAGTRGP